MPKSFERFNDFLPHPLAFWRNGIAPVGGACGMKNGDIVQMSNGRPCRLDEALSDGEALVTTADGGHTILNWANLRPWPEDKKR